MRTSSLPSYPEKFGSRLRYCLAEREEQKEQARPANGNRSKHRYAGLLRCQECGNVFVPMIRTGTASGVWDMSAMATSGLEKAIAAPTLSTRKRWTP